MSCAHKVGQLANGRAGFGEIVAVYNIALATQGIYQSSHDKCASDWAVSSVVEHCLHTAGVTSSKLVPPTKIINKIKYLQRILPTNLVKFVVQLGCTTKQSCTTHFLFGFCSKNLIASNHAAYKASCGN